MSDSTQKFLSFFVGIVSAVVVTYNFLEGKISAAAEARIKLIEIDTRAYENHKQVKEDIYILRGNQDNIRRELDDARSRITLLEFRLNSQQPKL